MRDEGFRTWRSLAVVVLGCGLGLAWNAASGRGFDLRSNVLVGPDTEVIDVAEARARLDRGALFLDARGVAWYEMGHVPGALALPDEEFDRHFPGLEARLRDRLDIVVYCSGFGCEASHNVAEKLRARGIPAAVLEDGWPAWEAAEYPVQEGSQP